MTGEFSKLATLPTLTRNMVSMSRWVFLALLAANPALAHDLITTKLTWTQEISRILNRHCAACHGKGADVPLSTYQEARPWAKAIKEEVLQRRMPPWGAVKGFGEFRNDPSLPQDEIQRIAEWVEGGAPEGNPQYLPLAATPAQANDAGFKRWSGTQPVRSHVALRAVRSLDSVADAKAIAQLPDGRVIPLLWLHGYQEQWRRVFVFREPLVFPPGTRISTSPPFRLELSLFPAR